MGAEQPERRRRYADKQLREVEEMVKNNPEATVMYYVDAAADEESLTVAAGINLRGVGMWAVLLEAKSPDDAEAQAVLTAVKHAYAEADKKRPDNEERKKPTTVMIFTGSQEVLRACKEHRLENPTVREIMKTAIRAREHHGIRLQLCWVPGHSGMEGNEAAHVAAREHKRFLLSSANGPLRQRATEISNGYREYNPTAFTAKAKAKLKKEMRTILPQEPYAVPTRGLRRYQMVLLRREVTQHNEKAANGFIVHPGCPSSRAGRPDPPTLVVARRSQLTVGARVQACGSSFPYASAA
ncbi:hypothetical protein HPB47_022702 [Ixodes persulcatus]|uniref:Uncharacterized protein n=1 Tax=Ixodes persulcatus TaxID=34615 RepID=A0AC60QBB4_IXOPE|nr:hypothetical protein HPB47_022702 [Ixodes persulcatus]